MPSSTRPGTPGPSNVSQTSKRIMSDVESAPQDPKRARRDSSAEPSARRDSGRDMKRRRKRKKKAPVVTAGAAKNEASKSPLGERSRAPLSARNEIIRFTSVPPEADLPASSVSAAKPSSQPPSSKLLGKTREGSSHTLDDITVEHPSEAMQSTPRDKGRAAPADIPVLEPSASSLGDKVVQLEAELKSKDNLIASHQALLNQVQQAVTCQVCLDLMYKPYALAPCGHLACHDCLVNWFTAPPPDNRPAPPAIMRKKTCPHCRGVVRERPVEVWGVKGIAQAMGKSGLFPNQLPIPVEVPESLDANADPWKDIFPKRGAPGHPGFPWFFPGGDLDDDDVDVDVADIAPRGEDVGMLDMEDGGIYRCLDCMHEIWSGVCSSCGRVYPGHRPEGDDEDDEGDPMGWLEDQMGAEEVDVADDPGWMGLEDGEADDGGDFDDWRPFAPWRRQFHMFPWGFLGTIHVDEEDEEENEDNVDGRVDDLRVPDEDEESGDEGYESSFIDDDEGGGVADLVDPPRIYEIVDDNDGEDYRSSRRARTIDLVADEHEEDEYEGYGPEPGWAGRGPAIVVISSDEEVDEREDDTVPSRQHSHSQRQRRGRGIVESDGSDTYLSDG